MFYYLTSAPNKDFFDILSEKEIINKEIIHHMSFDGMMKFVKQDLRNIEVEYLAIDMSILELEEGNNFNDILDILYVLNPISKIIIINAPSPGDIQEHPNLLVYQGSEATADILSWIPIQGTVTETKDVYVQPARKAEAETKPKSSNKAVGRKSRKPSGAEGETKQKKVKQVLGDNFKETEAGIAASPHAPEEIYSKAASPNKVSEGVPLIKRIRQELDQEVATDRKAAGVVELNTRKTVKAKEVVSTTGQWSCSNVVIALVGTERKVGTTAAAINLASYLAAAGARVTYSEANTHGHLALLAKEYGYSKVEGHYTYNSMFFFENSEFDQEAGMNFIILDLGSFSEGEQLQQRQLKVIKEIADHVIVVSGKQPYEQKALLYALYLLSDREVNILFSYTEKGEMAELQEKYKKMAGMVSYVPYEPVMHRLSQWPEEIRQILNLKGKEPARAVL